MMESYRIGVVGCAGRMGRMLLKVIAETEGCAIAGGTEAHGHEAVGRDVGELIGAPALDSVVGDEPLELFAAADAVIDFTVPAASVAHSVLAAQAQVPHIIGTTGLKSEDHAAFERAAVHCPVVVAPNMSLVVNVLLAVVEQAARWLGPDYDIEVVEMHHRHKVDAPSGTALALGAAAARGRDVVLDEVAQRVRDGITGERRRGDIGFATLRGGDVAGEHCVIYAGLGERLELGHRTTSRETYARGAVQAALWARGRKPGLYTMKDVLGL